MRPRPGQRWTAEELTAVKALTDQVSGAIGYFGADLLYTGTFQTASQIWALDQFLDAIRYTVLEYGWQRLGPRRLAVDQPLACRAPAVEIGGDHDAQRFPRRHAPRRRGRLERLCRNGSRPERHRHVDLAGKQVALPEGSWKLVARGFEDVEELDADAYGAIETLILFRLNGRLVEAFVTASRNFAPVEEGWGTASECLAEDVELPLVVQYDAAGAHTFCGFAGEVRNVVTAASPDAWRQAAEFIGRRALSRRRVADGRLPARRPLRRPGRAVPLQSGPASCRRAGPCRTLPTTICRAASASG